MNMNFAPKKGEQHCNYRSSEVEVKFCRFIAEHNISFTGADHLSDLVKSLFPDSKIAKVRLSISNFRH